MVWGGWLSPSASGARKGHVGAERRSSTPVVPPSTSTVAARCLDRGVALPMSRCVRGSLRRPSSDADCQQDHDETVPDPSWRSTRRERAPRHQVRSATVVVARRSLPSALRYPDGSRRPANGAGKRVVDRANGSDRPTFRVPHDAGTIQAAPPSSHVRARTTDRRMDSAGPPGGPARPRRRRAWLWPERAPARSVTEQPETGARS